MDVPTPQSLPNLEFLKMVDAVVLGVLMFEAAQAFLEAGLRRNYRLVLQLVIVILFAELFIIQQTYHSRLGIPYSQGALTFDLFLLALPFVCLSRLITASFARDEKYLHGIWVFGAIFLLLLARQVWFILWYPDKFEEDYLWIRVPIGFDAVGLSICAVGVRKLGVADLKERERRRNGWAKAGLVLLALYFLFSRLLKEYDNKVLAGYRSLIVTCGLVFALAIADLARKPDTGLLVHEKLFRWARRLCFVPLIWCTALVFLDDSQPGVDEVVILVLGAMGALLTAWGKYDLDDQHAWAGQFRIHPVLVDRGMYKWLRHPMYTGIVIFMVAGAVVLATSPVSRTLPWSWGSGMCVLILLFLGWYVIDVAGAETRKLEGECTGFRKYRSSVHAWWPFRRPDRSAEQPAGSGDRRDPGAA